MAFMEGKVQGINLADLLAMGMQNKRTREDERAKQLQNELLKQQIQKNKDVRNLALGQGGIPYTSALSNSASIGYPEFRLEQERQKALSQLTGQPLPTQGIIGGGFGGGRGMMGGGEPMPQGNPYSYVGPDHSKPITHQGPWPGTQPVGKNAPATIADLLADEKANVAGLISLNNQAGQKTTGSDIYEGAAPTADALNKADREKEIAKQIFLKQGDATVAPKQTQSGIPFSPQEQLDLTTQKNTTKSEASKAATDKKTLASFQNKIYSNEQWDRIKDPVLREQILSELPEAIRQNEEIGRILDVEKYLLSFRTKK